MELIHMYVEKNKPKEKTLENFLKRKSPTLRNSELFNNMMRQSKLQPIGFMPRQNFKSVRSVAVDYANDVVRGRGNRCQIFYYDEIEQEKKESLWNLLSEFDQRMRGEL